MQTDSHVTIKFPLRKSNDYAWFVEGVDLPMCHAGQAKARKLLADAAKARVADLEELAANQRKMVLMCGDGTVIVVRFEHGCWGYSMARSTRSYAGSCCFCPGDKFDYVVAKAREHAEQAFGNVLWQSSV